MAQSEAKKASTQKYKTDKCKTLTIRFYPTDMELLDYVKSKENTAKFIKDCIREDMERGR